MEMVLGVVHHAEIGCLEDGAGMVDSVPVGALGDGPLVVEDAVRSVGGPLKVADGVCAPVAFVGSPLMVEGVGAHVHVTFVGSPSVVEGGVCVPVGFGDVWGPLMVEGVVHTLVAGSALIDVEAFVA